jgi:N-hydroxyarylamine O-acetyltransferase
LNLSAYFDRIRFNRSVRADYDTLCALHRAHQLAVPFENLDVQLGRTIGLDADAAFAKIVVGRRGGWCYEMNGTFGAVLADIGFDVQRVTAGVLRERAGDEQMGNHLCLLVRLDQTYLVDVGFGGSMLEPLPLRAIERVDPPYHLALAECDSGYWRFTEHTGGDPFSFDFGIEPANEELMVRRCQYLQTSSASPFVQNLVVQRRTVDAHLSLRGRVLTITHSDRQEKLMLESAAELVATLFDKFELNVPEAADLWPRICARHEAVFASEQPH